MCVCVSHRVDCTHLHHRHRPHRKSICCRGDAAHCCRDKMSCLNTNTPSSVIKMVTMETDGAWQRAEPEKDAEVQVFWTRKKKKWRLNTSCLMNSYCVHVPSFRPWTACLLTVKYYTKYYTKYYRKLLLFSSSSADFLVSVWTTSSLWFWAVVFWSDPSWMELIPLFSSDSALSHNHQLMLVCFIDDEAAELLFLSLCL